jgi:Kef-type K+ transport system membrane component KefB
MLLLRPDAGGVPYPYLALAFAAIAVSTAPAGTVAVLHQYRARGPLATTLLGVVAVDDALGIVLFALMIVVTAGTSLADGIATAAVSIGGALALGAACGWLLARAARHLSERGLRLPLLLGGVLLVVGAADALAMSPLLAAMALGFCARHWSRSIADRLFGPIEFVEETIFVVFFTLAGAHFRAGVLGANLALAGTYLVARVVGKMLGAAAGARLGRSEPTVTRWLGLGLVPQAGVAMGLALTLAHEPAFRACGEVVVNTILATTLVYEVIGPLAARFALARAGELGVKRERRAR